MILNAQESIPARPFHLPFPRHNRTAFIKIDTGSCAACGECIAACTNEVLGMIACFRHRHVHVDRASRCKGCRKCIKVCQQGAIELRVEVSGSTPQKTACQ